MRFILVDWGTTRFRAFVVDGETIVDRVSSDEGVSALREGQHREVFLKHCRDWLAREPQAPVALVGMVGSREGWRMAPYAPCPAGPQEIAGAMIEVEIEDGRKGHIIPGLVCEPDAGAVDVMRGEETLCLGAGITDGLICLPGTHPKWVEMKAGRIERFATYFTGEMYALLRHHSMVGRPATRTGGPGRLRSRPRRRRAQRRPIRAAGRAPASHLRRPRRGRDRAAADASSWGRISRGFSPETRSTARFPSSPSPSASPPSATGDGSRCSPARSPATASRSTPFRPRRR